MEDGKNITKPIILVAEDTESNYLLVSAILRDDYQLEWAHNGIEAIDLYQKLHPAVILMDIHMPDMDGLLATKKIREIDKKVPIIAVTAYAFDADRRNAIAAGCNSFITKPISIIDLKDKLKEAIG
jgi:CheY-like chemotaxis protein